MKRESPEKWEENRKNIKKMLIGVRNGGWISPVLNEIEELLFSQREEILKEVDNKTIKLLKEFSNTPLNKRGNGWDWLIKIKNELKNK